MAKKPEEVCQCCEKEAEKGDGVLRNHRMCTDCDTRWLVFRCAGCGNAIDNRRASRCSLCDWYICTHCGAHKHGCIDVTLPETPLDSSLELGL